MPRERMFYRSIARRAIQTFLLMKNVLRHGREKEELYKLQGKMKFGN